MHKPEPGAHEGVDLKRAVEALLFITEKPLSVGDLCRLTGAADENAVREALAQINGDMEAGSRGLRVMEVAEGFQLATRPEHAALVKRLYAEKLTLRLSNAALETLAVIAYRQPVTRADIETIRGVDAVASLETLLERGFVKVAGRRESLGRPLLYGTTMDFLRRFGLKSIEELPALESFATESPADSAAGGLPSVESSAEPAAAQEEAAASLGGEGESSLAPDSPAEGPAES